MDTEVCILMNIVLINKKTIKMHKFKGFVVFVVVGSLLDRRKQMEGNG